MEVIDSFAYNASPHMEELGTDLWAFYWSLEMVKLIDDTAAVGESLLFVEDRCYGDIATDGEHLFYVNNSLIQLGLTEEQLVGDPKLGVWGEDYSYSWTEPDSEIVFGVEVLNENIIAVGFEHGLSILNYENLDSIYQVAYYRDLDSTFRLTHFAMKDNRLYAMGHPRDYVSRMYMFKLDDDVWASIDESPNPAKPSTFTISAYPNPFNSAVTIAAPAGAEVEIFDLNGRRIETLRPSGTSGTGPSGLEKGGMEVPLLKGDLGGSFTWQPAPTLASGVYLVRAKFPQETASAAFTKRIVYLK